MKDRVLCLCDMVRETGFEIPPSFCVFLRFLGQKVREPSLGLG